MLRAVLDTNVLISVRRSRLGASNILLEEASDKRFSMLVSVPLFLEYEAVLTRPEHLLGLGLDRETTLKALNHLVGFVEPVWIDYLWRPQTIDPADDMVIETAINGRADYIVTFNERHFFVAARFGIKIAAPGTFLGLLR